VSHHPNRSIGSRSASREFIPDAGRKAQHLAGCHLAAPRQATTPVHRSGLRPTRVAAWPLRSPAFRPWGASRASPAPGLLCRLLTSAGRSGRSASPSARLQDIPPLSQGKRSYLPCIGTRFMKHSPFVDGGLCGRVPARPDCTTPHIGFVSLAPPFAPGFLQTPPHGDALALHWSFGSTTPGQGTFTPKHDRLHGTHARRSARL
jgi:hypothetical protein